MQLLSEIWMDIVITVALTLILSLMSYKFDLLTKSGCIAAAFMGIIIGLFGSISWLFLLIVFALSGFAATLVGLSKKKEKGLQEGTHGERTYKNVLGVGLPPCIIAILNLATHDSYYTYMTIGYIASIAVAAADTAASEIGVKDPKVYLITTFKRVPVGTDGGISLFGTAISLFAAFIVSLIGWGVIYLSFDWHIIIPTIAGLIGCILDSYVGATLETWGYVSKYGNNCITGVAGALIAVGVAFIL